MSSTYPAHNENFTGDDFNILDLIKVMWGKKSLILVIVTVIVAAVLAVLLLITPRYSSQVQILLENRETSFTRPDAEVPQNRYQIDTAAVSNQIQVLRAKELALQIIKEFKLENNPEFNVNKDSLLVDMAVLFGFMQDPTRMSISEKVLKVYYKRLSVFQVGTSRVISAEFSSRDPELAARVANRLADFYIDGQRRAKTDTNFEASQWLKSQIESLRKKVSLSESAVENYRTQNGLFEGRPNTTLSAQQLTELSTQLVRARAERSEAQARARMIRNMLAREGGVDSAADVLRSPLIQRLREQQVRLKRQIAEMSATLLPSHPRMAQLRADLRNLNRQLDGEARKVVKGLENEAMVSAAREAEIRRSFEQLKRVASVSNKAEVKMRALEREAKANRDLLESFLKKYHEASARDNVESTPANARIISHATVSSIPSYPKKGFILALAALGAFMLGGFVVAVRAVRQLGKGAGEIPEEMARTAQIPDEVQEILQNPDMLWRGAGSFGAAVAATDTKGQGDDYKNLPVIAKLPTMNNSPQSRSYYDQQIYNLFQIAFQRSIMSRSKLVVVTSAASGQGEMKTAFDMARMMQKNRLKTILVDADFRNPELQNHLGLGQHPGLAGFLSGRFALSQSIARSSASDIDVMVSGHSSIDPAQLLNPQRLATVLGALDRLYDIMVVKAPPPGLFPETAWLAAKSCMSMICTQKISAGQNTAQALHDLVSQGVDSARIGVILTGLEEQDFDPAFSPEWQAGINPQARPYPSRDNTDYSRAA